MKAEQYLAEAIKTKTGFDVAVSTQIANKVAKTQKILSICENDDRTQLRAFQYAKEPKTRQ